jgi:hypothetical protein
MIFAAIAGRTTLQQSIVCDGEAASACLELTLVRVSKSLFTINYFDEAFSGRT